VTAIDHKDVSEPLDEGGTWLLDLVAAVDHLRRGIKPGFTVWDALEEALRWHTIVEDTETPDEPEWGSRDPLRRTLTTFAESTTGRFTDELQMAIRRWVLAVADRYNSGHHWPNPAPRRLFPPPAIVIVPDDGASTSASSDQSSGSRSISASS
jgi:hypothetical protein